MRRKKFFMVGYPPEFNASFKRYIRRRDGLRCAICQHKARLDVHHIDYRKQNTTKYNCVSLCRKCHQKIHDSAWIVKMDWKIKLSKLVWEREGKDGQ